MRQYIKAIVVFTGISFYMIFQYEFIANNVKLNEEYFIVTSLCMAFFAFMSIEKTDHLFIRSLIVLFSAFFLALVLVYIQKWVIEDDGNPKYYKSIYISGIVAFLYLLYDLVEKYLKQLYYAIFGRNRPVN